MMKQLTLSLAVALAASVATAQDNATTAPANARTATPAARSAVTSPSAAMAAAFSQEAFDKRWQLEEKMYKDAGISDEKIAKLKEINQKMWDARKAGETESFQELSRQRKDVLSQEEVEKLRNARRDMIQSRLGRDKETTAPAAATQQ